MHKNQNGFSAVEIVLVIVIVGLIATVGWFTYQSNKTANKNLAATKTDTNSTYQDGPTLPGDNTAPEGYTTYHDTHGFTIFYPLDWGDLKKVSNSNIAYNLSTDTLVDKPISKTTTLSGALTISYADKSSFKISAKKYGATVAPVKTGDGYDWKVVDVNPADTEDKIGDIYPVESSFSTANVPLYAFNFQDEGASYSYFVFETKDSFVTVGLPAAVETGTTNSTSGELSPYDNLVLNIQTSVQLDE